MSTLVKVQHKGQVTIPTRLRVQVGLADGDLVEARAQGGKIILTPQLVVDRISEKDCTPSQRRTIDARLAEAIEQAKKGGTFGPFESQQEMMGFLRSRAKRPRKTKTTKSKMGR